MQANSQCRKFIEASTYTYKVERKSNIIYSRYTKFGVKKRVNKKFEIFFSA